MGDGTLVRSQERRALAVPVINRWSTGCFVTPSVYMGSRLFVFPKGRSRQLYSMPWGARRTVQSWPERPVGVPPVHGSAPPRRSVARRSKPTRSWYIWVLGSTVIIQETSLRCFGGYEGRLSPGRIVLSASRPARPRRAAPPCAPTRPARDVRVLDSTNELCLNASKLLLPKSRLRRLRYIVWQPMAVA